jgi:hypothetical protein
MILWDFPAGRAPRRYTFYRVLNQDLRGSFTLLQRSVAGTADPAVAAQIARLAEIHGAAKVGVVEVIRDGLDDEICQAAKERVEDLLHRRLARRGRRGAAS